MYKLRFYQTSGIDKGNLDHEEFFATKEEVMLRYAEVFKKELFSLNPTIWEYDCCNQDYFRIQYEPVKKSDTQKLIEIIQKEAEYDKQAKLNRIASELKVDYIDLMQVVDEPMTIELGEALRVQMIEMFKTLKRCGIDVTSRLK